MGNVWRFDQKLLFSAVVLICMVIFFYRSTQSFRYTLNQEVTYKNLPRITLVTRTSSNPRLIRQFYCMYLRSVVLFWPGSYGGMAMVLDQGSKNDETWGTILKRQMSANFPGRPLTVHYEPLPNDVSILKNHSRSMGYNRQLWSTFFADLYTDSPIIAYMDTDTQFVTPMTKEYLYNGGKLKVFGEGGRPAYTIAWENSTFKALGLPQVTNFMITFPQLIFRDTVISTRKHIMKHLKTENFEEAFRQLYVSNISPVNIWMTYAWFHEHDRYDWHIKAPPDKLMAQNKRLPKGHKIGPEHTVPSLIGNDHLSGRKEFVPELMLAGYCMSLAATQQAAPPGCRNVSHDVNRFCDFWEPASYRYPWPAADTWCKAGKMDRCCHQAMVKHYKDVVVLAKEKNLRFSKDDVYLVDQLALEMGVTCPKIDLP